MCGETGRREGGTNPHILNCGGVHDEHDNKHDVSAGARDRGEGEFVDSGSRGEAVASQDGLGSLLNVEVVQIVAADVNEGEQKDGPGDDLVEAEVLVDGDDAVDEGVPDEGDEVPADRDEDDGAAKVENGSTCLRLLSWRRMQWED